MSTTIERLRAILAKDYKLAPEALTPDAPLEGLGIDSLATAELLFNVEDEFKVALDPPPDHLTTIDDVVRYIDMLVSAQRSGGRDDAGAAPVLRTP